jgi:hypothetical protein
MGMGLVCFVGRREGEGCGGWGEEASLEGSCPAAMGSTCVQRFCVPSVGLQHSCSKGVRLCKGSLLSTWS